ncbi:WYL domain-containing protein [Bacteroides sp. D20]|uniref:WYL domain-containing protein n=1 Tax=Bacteroides sp. D20 TaxID=585543 RepID=UPI002540A85B|nr:WYL domain-containing protein [Bacteroides sp. D20]
MGSNALSVSERKIEAVGIFFSRTNWYLIGFYLPKEIYLTFRIDRIQKMHILNELQSREHPSLENSYASFMIKKNYMKSL